MKKCGECKEEFEPIFDTQMICLDCQERMDEELDELEEDLEEDDVAFEMDPDDEGLI